MSKESNKSKESTQLKIVETKGLEAVAEDYKTIIDEYYSNGYNGTKAVLSVREHLQYSTARLTWSLIQKSEPGAKYIQERKQRLRATANVAGEQLLKELLQFAYSDATDYIGLNPDEIKALPNEVKRCIQSIKHRKKEYTDRSGNLITEEVTEVRIVDKLKAIDMINKHIGFYSEDNKQKKQEINIQNLNVEQLKVLQTILSPDK